jgi:hypothetical protein
MTAKRKKMKAINRPPTPPTNVVCCEYLWVAWKPPCIKMNHAAAPQKALRTVKAIRANGDRSWVGCTMLSALDSTDRRSRVNATPHLWRNINIRLLLPGIAPPLWPITPTAIAPASEIAGVLQRVATWQVTACIAWCVTTYIAKSTLRTIWSTANLTMPTASDTAQIGSLPDECQAAENAVEAHRSVAKCRATCATCVLAVCAAEAFVGRDVLLISTNGGE